MATAGRSSTKRPDKGASNTMTQGSRRDFLRTTATASGATALGSLASQAAHAAEGPAPKMTIARWKGEAVPEEKVDEMAAKLTRAAIEDIGGLGQFISNGDVVCVKPNIGWDRSPEQAANTNPAVVAVLVKMCLDAGAKTVRVGDHSVHNPRKSYSNSRIAQAAEEAGAEVFYVDARRFRKTDVGGERLKEIGLCPEMAESDLLISVPITKDHSATSVTLAMKNYMGVVDDRRVFHQDLPTYITDITRYMKPRISVLDSVRILTASGPTGGNLSDVARADCVAVSTDIVALDAFGSELLKRNPADIGTVVKGDEKGLGQMDYKQFAKEISIT